MSDFYIYQLGILIMWTWKRCTTWLHLCPWSIACLLSKYIYWLVIQSVWALGCEAEAAILSIDNKHSSRQSITYNQSVLWPSQTGRWPGQLTTSDIQPSGSWGHGFHPVVSIILKYSAKVDAGRSSQLWPDAVSKDSNASADISNRFSWLYKIFFINRSTL